MNSNIANAAITEICRDGGMYCNCMQTWVDADGQH